MTVDSPPREHPIDRGNVYETVVRATAGTGTCTIGGLHPGRYACLDESESTWSCSHLYVFN
jgi:hypothetical protein